MPTLLAIVMSILKEDIQKLALAILAENGLDLVEMKFSDSGPTWFLRMFIDKPGGVSVEDCAKVSRKISDCLDTEDLIPHKYLLEVSSPGLDRLLVTKADFRRKIGKKVRMFLKEKMLDTKEVEGKIIRLEDDKLILQHKNEEMAIPLIDIVEAKIIF